MTLRLRPRIVPIIVVVGWLAIFRPWTIRPIAEEPHGPFDAKAYVSGIWTSRVLPALQSQAIPFSDFQNRHTTRGTPVTLDAVVVAVNTTSRAGTAALDVSPADGRPDALLTIGPVVLGTALRDALGFVQFSDFTNQIQFADVASALNDRALAAALDTVTPADLKGRAVQVLGVAWRDSEPPDTLPLVIPVQLTVGARR